MATLLIGIAVSIAINLAINALFPPPDVNQFGPRLNELGYTSSAYGKFVNITFGTDRIDGNIIDTEDPAIEEVVTQNEQSGGKGGGPTVTQTTYTYFFTGRIAFATEGATDLVQLYGDGKLVWDADGGGLSGDVFVGGLLAGILTQRSRGISLTLYPGGPDQPQDSDEVNRAGRNATEQPAYRHLTSVKLNRMALADYGNRIPNFTAVMAFKSEDATPAVKMTEPAGLNPPGSLTGADTSYMLLDPTRNRLVSLKEGTGTWSADAVSLQFLQFITNSGTTKPGYGLDGFIYNQRAGSNRNRLQKIDVDTDEIVGTVGDTGTTPIIDDFDGFGNNGSWTALTTAIPGLGRRTLAIHVNELFPSGGPPNGAIVDGDALTAIDSSKSAIVHIISTADGLVDDGGPLTGFVVPDHDRGRFFILQDDDLNGEYRLVRYVPKYEVGTSGPFLAGITASLVRQFTRGTFGTDDFGGTGEPTGWALNRRTGDLMMCNGTSIVLYNPDSDQILATKENGSLHGRNNYYSGGIFAFGDSQVLAGKIFVVDTRTLGTIHELDMQTIQFTDDTPGIFHEESLVWDDRVGALMMSRVDVGSNAAVGERVVKIFVNRVNGLGVGLDTVVSALCTEYNGIVLAGMDAEDFDVTTLAGDTVEGYTLNNRTDVAAALTPLRNRFQFDAVQSDWKIKFPKRGAAPVLTIPEEFVGELKRGRTERDNPPVVEMRTQDTELPVKFNIRYRNKEAAYDIDTEHDKRQRFPAATMSSKSERTLDIPLVDTPAKMRPVAQNWLWTVWNERRQFKTIVPWTYMELDPTDVFNMGVFGETQRLRLTDQDIGLGYAMDITGVAEETYTFSSTIPAGVSKGRPLNVVPSDLPTQPLFLNAPLLSFNDITVAAVSNAYIAAGALEASWRGATFLKSPDGVDYQTTAAANVEATNGKVKVAPPAMRFSNGNPTNRLLEIADGGTMTITPLRGSGNWLSATELNMYNGANNFAVVYPTGEVQVAQYVDATANVDGTITLDRLLLGRLGTEDVAAVAPPIASLVVLLSDNTGVIQQAAIQKQQLALSELDVPLFFKAVTVGTLLEDATAEMFTYTGRDVRPFTVADIRVGPDGGTGLDVSWFHRTRGPEQGEWLNFIATVPLNETIEQYEVTLDSSMTTDFITKTVNDTNTVNFTAGEIAPGGPIPGITAKVVQVSGTGLKSPTAQRQAS